MTDLEPPIEAVISALGADCQTGISCCETALAEHLGVLPEQIVVGCHLLETAAKTFLGPGDLAVVAEPTDARIIDAVLASLGRYVDAGRNHRFEADPQGLTVAASSDHVRLAYLASPNEPTGTMLSQACIDAATRASAILLLDQRFALHQSPAHIAPNTLMLRSFEATAGLDRVEFVVGPETLVRRLRGQPIQPCDAAAFHAVLKNPTQVADRVERLISYRSATYNALRTLPSLVVSEPNALGIWVRVPGKASATIAGTVNHPSVHGSTSWTWRDAVSVTPVFPAQCQGLLDALTTHL